MWCFLLHPYAPFMYVTNIPLAFTLAQPYPFVCICTPHTISFMASTHKHVVLLSGADNICLNRLRTGAKRPKSTCHRSLYAKATYFRRGLSHEERATQFPDANS
jgi:hypothetical protein